MSSNHLELCDSSVSVASRASSEILEFSIPAEVVIVGASLDKLTRSLTDECRQAAALALPFRDPQPYSTNVRPASGALTVVKRLLSRVRLVHGRLEQSFKEWTRSNCHQKFMVATGF